MQLSIREAATLLGQSPRTVRARVHRGDLPGRKVGGCWSIDRRDLPLTESQRRSLQDKADRLRRTVEDALPSRLARTAGSRTRSVADLEAFRLGAELLGQMNAPDDTLTPEQARARQLLESALLALRPAACWAVGASGWTGHRGGADPDDLSSKVQGTDPRRRQARDPRWLVCERRTQCAVGLPEQEAPEERVQEPGLPRRPPPGPEPAAGPGLQETPAAAPSRSVPGDGGSGGAAKPAPAAHSSRSSRPFS